MNFNLYRPDRSYQEGLHQLHLWWIWIFDFILSQSSLMLFMNLNFPSVASQHNHRRWCRKANQCSLSLFCHCAPPRKFISLKLIRGENFLAVKFSPSESFVAAKATEWNIFGINCLIINGPVGTFIRVSDWPVFWTRGPRLSLIYARAMLYQAELQAHINVKN